MSLNLVKLITRNKQIFWLTRPYQAPERETKPAQNGIVLFETVVPNMCKGSLLSLKVEPWRFTRKDQLLWSKMEAQDVNRPQAVQRIMFLSGSLLLWHLKIRCIVALQYLEAQKWYSMKRNVYDTVHHSKVGYYTWCTRVSLQPG